MTQLNRKSTARFAAVATLVYLSFAAAQPSPQGPPGTRPQTLEERVAALERGLASVTTRFEIRESAVPPSQSGAQNAAAFESRVSSLERSIDRLQQEIQNVQRAADSAQRAADSASRDAGDARRTAQSAENLARDAQLRPR
jgi:predicted  nucleic acid-binding Zn-ribbon protein